ncbi:MAG: CinA family protein [Methanomassiliicoccales archaeon]|nr:CinA family protein [Methanomassiliicoccales archaeon]
MLENDIIEKLRRGNLTLAVAESCTGGHICDRLTNIPGCSDVFLGGMVAYSNDSKVTILGVQRSTIREHGAVSEECAREMAQGVMRVFGADVGVSVTGIAGPGGGSPEKPVGLVFTGLVHKEERLVFRMQFDGTREYIKRAASDETMMLTLDFLP